ncbi:hypothetical protein CC1G_15467 [Coprinopsis cinerea okayama7|uniref:Nucleoporin NDC1 n=1 Tax=Coprinopsis cinerea (strain Okayama-7 / 130 / ATCC MYA-4618 / FGSC 9003) TaxID=240176 RepID=D6RQQ9_COPC7|nr:hypothetical protein CC1G_15467 [Coprinopsis cinerea okayama7\|eukprot:XP_002910190.1 hypothetical protein CC1G_15467 [Coprinopsis cinerea okayama7\
MSLPSTPKTPIRAITSTLINRASPSVPPASQNYEPLVKSVLAYRLSRLFLQSATVCWATQSVWSIWQSGGIGELGLYGILLVPFRPVTLLGAFLLWIAASVPVVVLRKTFIHSERTPATSPHASLKAALSKSSTKPALFTYLASATILVVVHAVLAYALESGSRGDPRLSLYVKSRKHPHYLNGRLLFLIFSQAAVCLSFLFRNMLRDRFAYRWVSMSSAAPSTLVDITVAAFIAVISITSALPIACFTFGAARMLVLPVVYKLPFLRSLLKPFVNHFTKGPYTFVLPLKHLTLLIRAWFLGFTTFFLWELSEAMFDGLISEPVAVTTQGSKSNPVANQTLLVSGITSKDPVMKYFSYAELAGVVQSKGSTAVAERQALFGDQKNGLNLWGVFVRETLLLLGEDYQRLLRRGAPPPPPEPTATTSATPLTGKKLVEGVEERINATPVPLLRRSILRNQSSSVIGSPGEVVLDQLASDGPIAQAVDKSAEAAHLPDLFKSVSSPLSKSILKPVAEAVPVPAPPVPSAGLIKKARTGICNAVKKSFNEQAPPQLKDEVDQFVRWWTMDRVSRLVDASLPMRELDVVVIEVLTKLVCASLEEDRYGVVQRDIPKILESLLSFLQAVEDYQAEIVKKYSPPPLPSTQPRGAGSGSFETSDGGQEQGEEEAGPTKKELEERRAMEAELEKATDLLGYVGDGLKDGIARIVRTFGDKLTAFRFPPRTAQKLQTFMDFCQ